MALIQLEDQKCRKCDEAAPEEDFLLCDGCCYGFHAHCLGQDMPETRFWFCPECNGLTYKGCIIQVLETAGSAGLTAAELNANVLALRDMHAEEISPELVAVYNNSTARERLRLCTGAHGRLDDGRCLVVKLPADSSGIVKYRLAPEDAPEHPTQSLLTQATAAASASDFILGQPTDPNATPVAESADTETAAADASLSQDDASPARNLKSEVSSTLQPRPDPRLSHVGSVGRRLEAADFAQLRQSTAQVASSTLFLPSGIEADLVPARGTDRSGSQRTTALQGAESQPSTLAMAGAGPVNQPQQPGCMAQLPGLSNYSSHSVQVLTLRLEATPDTSVPQASTVQGPSHTSSGDLTAPVEGMHSTASMELSAPRQAGAFALSPSYQPAAASGLAQAGMQAVSQQPRWNAMCTKASSAWLAQSGGPSEIVDGAETGNEAFGTGCYADEMQDNKPASAGPAANLPGAQSARSHSPAVALAHSTSIVVPDSLEQSPLLEQLDPCSSAEHAQGQDPGLHTDSHHIIADKAASVCAQMHHNLGQTACDHHMLHDFSTPLGTHRSQGNCAEATDRSQSCDCVQEEDGSLKKDRSGLGCMHQLQSTGEATISASGMPAGPATGIVPYVSCDDHSSPAGQAVTEEDLPQMSAMPVVRTNKRKRHDDGEDQGAVLGKQHCSAAGHWSTVCCNLVQTVYRLVLIVWLVLDQVYDKP